MQAVQPDETGPKPSIGYVFDNRNEPAGTRYRELSTLYDAQTIHHIEQRGIEDGFVRSSELPLLLTPAQLRADGM